MHNRAETGSGISTEVPRKIVKDVPAVGHLVAFTLWKTNHFGGPIHTFDELREQTRKYEKGHVTWEWFRKQQASGIYGAAQSTGAEKFFACIQPDPQEIAIAIAEIGQRTLDTSMILHRHEFGFRNHLDKALHGEDFSNPKVLEELETMFGAVLGRLRAVRNAPHVTDQMRRASDTFITIARQKVDMTPPIEYAFNGETESIGMSFILPAKIKTEAFIINGGISVPGKLQDGMDFMQNIGRMSNPLIRRALVLLRDT